MITIKDALLAVEGLTEESTKVIIDKLNAAGFKCEEQLANSPVFLKPTMKEWMCMAKLNLCEASAVAVVQERHTAAPAGGGATEEEPAVHKFKKVKINDPPSRVIPSYVASHGLVPQAGRDSSNVAYYCGREEAVGLHTALPALLQAPEFGLVHDAAFDAPGCVAPQPKHFQAATELSDIMALVYSDEKQRQNAFLSWFKKHFPVQRIVVPRSNSSSTSGNNDGAITFNVGAFTYCIGLLEAKLDGGDALLQALRYIQKIYNDGACWMENPVLRASGGPVLIFELLGTCLTIHGAFTIEGNVMAAEPLTPRLILLPLHDRQEQPALQLARVLAGLEAGLLLLRQRLLVMAGQVGVQPEELLDEPELDMSADYKVALVRALKFATLVGEDAQLAAARPGVLALPPADPARWARLPYPLLSSCCFETPEQVEGYAERPLFICDRKQEGAEGRVFVKFTRREYPVKVHNVLAALELTTKLLDCVRLPGGWYMVVQDYLGDDWKPCSSLTPQQLARAHPLLAAAMHAMHAARLEGSDAAIVHGDLRRPNVMWHERDGRVKIVDLDWAGLEGAARYPAQMASNIPWHVDARPGRVLKRAHDVHLLDRFV